MPSLANPTGSSPILAGVRWIQDTMLGEVASIVAIVAVAGVGAAMLTGRIELRRGLTVVLGCFLLFGASLVADGIRRALDMGVGDGSNPIVATITASAPPAVPVSHKPPDDPYAGASVFVGSH